MKRVNMRKRLWMVFFVVSVLALALAPVLPVSAQQAQGEEAGGLDLEAEPGLPASCTAAVYTQYGGDAYLIGESYASTAEGVIESTVFATGGGCLTLKSPKISKTGVEGGDYGGQAVEAAGQSAITLLDAEIFTDTKMANGIWATEGALVYMKGGSITAIESGGHGVDVTKRANVVLYDVEINTDGASASGALVNDAGDGSIFATKVTAHTKGPGSSGFYMIGDMSTLVLNDSTLTADSSEGGVAVHGPIVTITDSHITGKNGLKVAGGDVSISGGSLTATDGVAFYVGGGEGGVPSGDSAGGGGGMPSMPGGGQGGGMPGGGEMPSGMPGGGQGGGMPGGGEMPSGMPGGEMPSGMSGGMPGGGMPSGGGLLAGMPGLDEIDSDITITGGTKISATGNLMTVADDITGTFSVSGTELVGDVEGGENCDFVITLNNSSLSGSITGVALTIGNGGTWDVTGDSALTSLSIAGGISEASISSIAGNGHTVTYDKTLSENEALGGKTYTLAKGGKLTPEK